MSMRPLPKPGCPGHPAALRLRGRTSKGVQVLKGFAITALIGPGRRIVLAGLLVAAVGINAQSQTNLDEATSSGQWSAEPALLAIMMQPRFWQALGLDVLLAFVLGMVAWAAYRRQVAWLQERRQAQETFARQLINAQEAERSRLARELHDDITQRLARLAIDVGRVERASPASEITHTMSEVRAELISLSEDVHSLSYRLHSSVLDDLGLAEALKAECERLSRQGSIQAQVTLRDLPPNVPRDVALGLFRIAQEALRNVARHARAKVVEITLRAIDGGLQLVLRDDGAGFDPRGRRDRVSLGLASIRERAGLLGGKLEIESAPGQGTTVLAWVPTEGRSDQGSNSLTNHRTLNRKHTETP